MNRAMDDSVIASERVLEADDRRDGLVSRWVGATGELVTAGLNELDPGKRRLVGLHLQRGSGSIALLVTLEPLTLRAILQLAAGGYLPLFEIQAEDGAEGRDALDS